jgi:xanthine dehydrogenase YagR molybdenum-binding subunit
LRAFRQDAQFLAGGTTLLDLMKLGAMQPAESEVKIDARYTTPTQRHNPIELFTTLCAWAGDHLTVWESSQNVTGFKYGLAEQLGLPPRNIRVISPYVGGAFGSRGALTGPG